MLRRYGWRPSTPCQPPEEKKGLPAKHQDLSDKEEAAQLSSFVTASGDSCMTMWVPTRPQGTAVLLRASTRELFISEPGSLENPTVNDPTLSTVKIHRRACCR